MPTLSQDCPSYCGDAFPEYTQPECNTKFKGGANQVVFLKCNTSFNTDLDAAAMGTAINGLIDTGLAALISNVKFNYDAPSAVTAPSYVGCVPDTFATNDWSFTLVDRNVSAESRAFYQAIIDDFSGEIGGMLVYECANDRMQYIPMVLTLNGGPVFPDQDTDFFRYEFSLIGRSNQLPYILDTPTGVFN